MWNGGVRVIVLDEDNRILMVKQQHPEREVWMVPGGDIEENEDASVAGVREVLEETGIAIEIGRLLWHVQEVGDRGQRFVDFFITKPADSYNCPQLGADPELDSDNQVLKDVQFMTREEVAALENLYPEWLRTEFWQMLEEGELEYDAFRKRG